MHFLDRYLTPAVKTILLLCLVFYFAPAILDLFKPGFALDFHYRFALQPEVAIFDLHLWQFVTYMFMHGGLFHLLFNMLALFFFGPAIENRLGTRRFWSFFLISGVVAAISHVALYYGFHRPTGMGLPAFGVPGLVGASGAIMFVLLAFAAYYPEQEVLLYLAIPVKMK
ncbi:MAG TPA: rhomboid family intramembrane serine protease, partial [Candidatus Sumerlaeota bacterium]|nr:rhomboid family intramembrane serine protease [Candidatus Sumerlaeota bacterium]